MANVEAAERPLRGSQKLLEHLSKNGEAPSIDEIKKAVALPPGLEWKILSWQIKGIPPVYLELDARIQVSTTDLAVVVNRFVQLNDSAFTFHILINGIPFPDVADISITNT
jgi:hypothetical protein